MLKVKRTYDKDTDKLIEATATCLCGTTLDFFYGRDCFGDIDCADCGRLYNSSGQELKPREQWEENIDADY